MTTKLHSGIRLALLGGVTLFIAGCSGNASLGANQSGAESSAGGTGGIGGISGTGNDTCSPLGACARAYECVEYCGGPLVSNDCCACKNGTIDRVTSCAGAGGSGGATANTGGSAATGGTRQTATGGATGVACGTAVCSPTQYCCDSLTSKCVTNGLSCVVGSGTGGSSGTGGTSGVGGTSVPGLHTGCVDGQCSSGLTPVTFYGVAGTAGPLFCLCEIPCDSTTKACPTNMICTSISDGPSNICAFVDSAGHLIWP